MYLAQILLTRSASRAGHLLILVSRCCCYAGGGVGLGLLLGVGSHGGGGLHARVTLLLVLVLHKYNMQQRSQLIVVYMN